MTAPRLVPMALCAALAAAAGSQTQFVDVAPRGHLPGVSLTTADVALGDVDGDGDRDALLATYTGPALYSNDGRGRFTDRSATALPNRTDTCLAVGVADLDGDGDLDAVFGTNTVSDLLYLGDGAGGFADVSSRLPPRPPSTGKLMLWDVDGDGDVDLLRGGVLLTGLQLLVNDGTGRFRDATSQLPAPPMFPLTTGIGLGDVDGDGDADLVWTTGLFGRFTQVYANDGHGVFTDVTSSALPGQMPTDGQALHLGDLDGDGDVDILVGASPINQLHLNDGTGVFTDVAATHLPTDRWLETDFAAGDFDEDGDVDILVAVATGFAPDANVLWLNTGGGRFVDATALRLLASARASRSITAADVDGDGDLDAFVGNGAGPFGAIDELYLNLHRHIETARPPAVGGTFGLEFVHAPGYGATPRLVLPGLAFALAPAPVPVPFGTLFLRPGGVLALPFVAVTPAAPARVSIGVPANLGLIGTDVFAQALIVDLFGSASPALTGYTADTIR